MRAAKVTKEEIAATLRTVLTSHGFTGVDTIYASGSGEHIIAVSTTVTGPNGLGSIGIGFNRANAGDAANGGDTSRGETKTELSDGSILWTHSGPKYPAGNAFPGENTNMVSLLRADGVVIDLQTTNAAGEKGFRRRRNSC